MQMIHFLSCKCTHLSLRLRWTSVLFISPTEDLRPAVKDNSRISTIPIDEAVNRAARSSRFFVLLSRACRLRRAKDIGINGLGRRYQLVSHHSSTSRGTWRSLHLSSLLSVRRRAISRPGRRLRRARAFRETLSPRFRYFAECRRWADRLNLPNFRLLIL